MAIRKHHFLTRHNAASHTEFLHYAYSLPMRDLCRMLNRHQRTVQRWLDGATVIPPWTIAVLKLARLEHQLIRDQMGFTAFEREAQSAPAIPLRHRMPAANEAVHEPRTRHQLPLPGFAG